MKWESGTEQFGITEILNQWDGDRWRSILGLVTTFCSDPSQVITSQITLISSESSTPSPLSTVARGASPLASPSHSLARAFDGRGDRFEKENQKRAKKEKKRKRIGMKLERTPTLTSFLV